MAFRFYRQETFRKAIPRIARERIDHVIESLSAKPHPDADSIHEARKNLKSLRALLRLARGSIDDGVRVRENSFFRDTGRSLSTIRDTEALLEALEYFRKRHPGSSRPSTPKQDSIRAFIEKTREDIQKNLIVGLAPGALKKLVRDLREAKRRTTLWHEGVLLQSENEWETFVGNGLRRTYRKAKNLVWQFEVIGHETVDDKAWHELRKCAKALGYQLRLLKPIWPGMLNSLGDEIDQLTDCLGDANDLSILYGRILNEPYDRSGTQKWGETRRFFLQSLDERKQKLHSEAFNLARLIYTEKPRQFERRLAEYWQIWQSQVEMKDTRKPGKVGRQADRQENAEQKAKAEVLASSSS